MRKLLFLVLLTTTCSLQALAALRVPSLPYEEQGVLDGAPYRIKVPANWNGTLLVYVRGTQRTVDPVGLNPLVAVPGVPPAISAAQAAALEQLLVADGYAFAASAFQDGAGIWSIEEGFDDTEALAKYFKKTVGKPERTILWSRSQGTIIGLREAEKKSSLYDASIAGCAVGAGASRTWDLTLDLLLAWQTAFGFPASWGTPADINDNIRFATDVVPVILQNLADPRKLGLFEFVRLVNRLPLPGFYPAPNSPPEASWLLSDMFFATEVRAEVERKAGGPVVQNLDHVYSLSAADRARIVALGVDADALLAVMNSSASKFAADKKARRYNERYADYSGKLKMPVLTLHTTQDGLVIVSQESAYLETVEEAGREHLLAQWYADNVNGGVGHCTFTPQQWYEAVSEVSAWLDTGIPPGPGAAPNFNPGFVPPPFPNP